MAPPKKREKLQRLEIHLPPALLVWLRLEAQQRDIPMGEVIRQTLRALMEHPK